MKRSILAFVHAEIAKNKKFRYILQIFLVKTPHPWKIAKPGFLRPFCRFPNRLRFSGNFPMNPSQKGRPPVVDPVFSRRRGGAFFENPNYLMCFHRDSAHHRLPPGGRWRAQSARRKEPAQRYNSAELIVHALSLSHGSAVPAPSRREPHERGRLSGDTQSNWDFFQKRLPHKNSPEACAPGPILLRLTSWSQQ